MKIAVVHSFYSDLMPSGENTVVLNQIDALRNRGHEVRLIRRDTDHQPQDAFYQAKSAFRVMTGAGTSPAAEIEEFKPDVVHLHNTFPNFGRNWVEKSRFPIVATLHNYRTVCAAGILARQGQDCDECIQQGSHRAVVNRCYRGSSIKSIPLSIATRAAGAHDPVLRAASRLVVLSPASFETFLQVGVDRDRLRLVPNFVPDPGPPSAPNPLAPWAFVGRLSVEKGALELVHAWPSYEPLQIVGAGPLESELRLAAAGKRIQFLGRVSVNEVPKILQKCKGLVFSSTWREMGPLTYLEALAAGRPVLTVGSNSVSDDVLQRGTGVVVGRFEELEAGLEVAHGSLVELSRVARAAYEEAHSPHSWTATMETVYGELAHKAEGLEPGLGGEGLWD